MTDALTLRRGVRELTLPDGVRALTLPRGVDALTVQPGIGSRSGTSGMLAQFAILQGFNPNGGFNRRVFLLYGLVGDLYDGIPAGGNTLTLRRGVRALTVE